MMDIKCLCPGKGLVPLQSMGTPALHTCESSQSTSASTLGSREGVEGVGSYSLWICRSLALDARDMRSRVVWTAALKRLSPPCWVVGGRFDWGVVRCSK